MKVFMKSAPLRSYIVNELDSKNAFGCVNVGVSQGRHPPIVVPLYISKTPNFMS